MNEPIHILIVDDHAIVREGLRALILGKPDLAVVGEAADGAQAIAQARTLQPDIILMDVVMPHTDGLEAIRQIRKENPYARIIVLTSFGDEHQVVTAIKAGALGYLLKDSSPQELIEAIRCVYRGESSLDPSVARKLMLQFRETPMPDAGTDALTERELQVLKLVAHGLSNDTISHRLFIGEGTVRVHVSNILGKLHLESRTQAALYALREKLVELEISA
jgi:NarL family two-component system response regulator LiaR